MLQRWIAMSEAFGGRNPKPVVEAEKSNNEYEPTAQYVLDMLSAAGFSIIRK